MPDGPSVAGRQPSFRWRDSFRRIEEWAEATEGAVDGMGSVGRRQKEEPTEGEVGRRRSRQKEESTGGVDRRRS